MSQEAQVSETHSSDSRPSEAQQFIEAVSSIWWIILVRGILLAIMGSYAFFQPTMTAMTLTKVLGIFVIADGIVAIITAIMGYRDSALWTIVRGILAIIVGLFVLSHPLVIAGVAAWVVMIVLAIQALASGTLEIFVAIRYRKEIQSFWLLIASGILSILFGLIIAASPLLATEFFIRVLGLYAVFFGISLIFVSFRTKNLAKEFSAMVS